MYISKKLVVSTLILIFSIGISLGVMADSNLTQISAWLNSDFKITLNGSLFIPKEADGTILKPIIYNDRTYLPIRAIGDATGLPVNFDASTSTVIIGLASSKGNDIFSSRFTINPLGFQLTNNADKMTINGQTYVKGYYALNSYINPMLDISSLGHQYTDFTFKVGTTDTKQVKLTIYDTSFGSYTAIKTVNFSSTDGMLSVDANVANLESIRLNFECTNSDAAAKIVLPEGEAFMK